MKKNRSTEKNHFLDKVPPHNIDAEEVVLCSFFYTEGSLTEARAILKPEDFYKGSHQKIFTAMLDCPLKDGTVDITILVDKLTSVGQLESIGGAAYLAHLMDASPLSSNVKKYAEIIFRCSIKRFAITQASEIIKAAFEDKTPLNVFMAQVDDLITDLKEKSAGASNVENLDTSFEQLFGTDTSSALIQTPFKDLNEKIGGLGKKELTIVAGKTGMGKSAYCLGQLRKTAIEEGKGVIYCGAQMDKNRIFLRIIAQMCNLNFRSLLSGRFPEDKRKEVMEAHKNISEAPIKHIILPERISLLDLQMSVTSALNQSKTEVELLIIENLQQLSWPGKDFGKNSFEEANFMIKKLKPWAQEINPAVIISSQLNRKVSEREDKHPDTTDIFSKDAEELADTILLLYRPNVYEKRTIDEPGRPERDAVIIIGKGGPPVEVPMIFWGDSMRWEDAEI